MPASEFHAAVRLVPLAQVAPDAIEDLLDAAFGRDRHGRTAYRIRDGVDWIRACSFAALDGSPSGGDMLVGSVQCWPIRLMPSDGSADVPLLLLGPVAVEPGRQQGGIGRLLTRAAIDAAAAMPGAPPLLLIGDPEYYGRFFGFDAAATAGWTLPGPFDRHRLLLRAPPGTALPPAGQVGPDRPADIAVRRTAS